MFYERGHVDNSLKQFRELFDIEMKKQRVSGAALEVHREGKS